MDLERVEAAAGAADPCDGLRTALALRRLAERLEALHVARAREQGMSWAEIAVELQVTRQTVHKKHGRTRGPGRWDTGRETGPGAGRDDER
ncbi:helix-turn-helix domain-containing protein [Kineococcus esterisolvens]|uniref:helix-turn-helix domain-containing protein n=1 Tax=unclassified Kineococcus TaxID=2621656 RepID=UPI003D7E6D97